MRIVLIAYNEAVDEEVIELLESCGASYYTKWTKVLGRGRSSGPHVATHVWPKANNVLAVATGDDRAKRILRGVKEFRERLGQEGVKGFLIPLEALT